MKNSYHPSKTDIRKVFEPLGYHQVARNQKVGVLLFQKEDLSTVLSVFTWSNFKHSPESKIFIEVIDIAGLTVEQYIRQYRNVRSAQGRVFSFTQDTWPETVSKIQQELTNMLCIVAITGCNA